jgi:hypothetical protein
MSPQNRSNIQGSNASSRMFIACFLILTVSHFLIGYTSLGTTPKLWVLFAGVLAPMFLWAFRAPRARIARTPFTEREFFGVVPAWVWILVFSTAVVLRLWQIDRLFCWPWGDEALSGEAAIDLSRQWDWKFFYSAGQSPPLLNWICAIFFKFSHSVFFNLWLPPALISAATMAAGYGAARQFFSKSFSLVCVGLLAFSYWPLWMGRCCLQAGLVPLGELLVFYLLGRYLMAEPAQKSVRALVLGVGAGLLSFTYVTWPLIVAAVVLGVAAKGKNGNSRPKALIPFAIGVFIALVPFITAVFREGYGQHLIELSAWNYSTVRENPFRIASGYLSLLVWGGLHEGGYYLPSRGGFWNPLTASLLCLGLINFFRYRSLPLVKWLMISILLFLLPGLLSLNVNGLRIVQALPLLLVITAWGLEPMMERSPRSKTAWLVVILLLTAVFDFSRLSWPYQDPVRLPERFLETGKSLERYRAFQHLEKIKNQAGPGIVLGEWDPSADRTLDVATYFWNAARNPGLSPEKAPWLGVVMEGYYSTFLARRFPEAQWKQLNGDPSKGPPLELCVISVDSSNRETFLKWAKADAAFRSVNRAIDHVNDKDCLETFDRDMKRDYPLVKGDAFLESCFWEKVGTFYYYYGGHYPEHLLSIQRALERGCPAPHLYYQLAGLYQVAGKEKEAQEAFSKAKRSSGDEIQ